MIPFNKPFLTGKEISHIEAAVKSGKISGNGMFTKKCHSWMNNRYGFKKCLLTTSCTDALEMCALLLELREGDEVIMPSYTFVSTANAFVLRGCKIVFADSYENNPNIDPERIAELVTKRTKAIVVVHYAGVACDMDKIMKIAEAHEIKVIEDAAQALESTYKGKQLGTIGELSAFSFHETKNVISGEGGLLGINRPIYEKRSEIIWEKGTNRSAFFRGEVDKYGWVDIGSSFLPSEITAAFLFSQLTNIEKIQERRIEIWNRYDQNLSVLKYRDQCFLPYLPDYASNNAHMYYLVCRSNSLRSRLINKLKDSGIHAVFHYLSLHKSKFYSSFHDGRKLINCDRFAENLIRLPFYYELKNEEIDLICDVVLDFFKNNCDNL